jgi:hypothetical protein
MAWHPTLSSIERETGRPQDRPRPVTDTQRREAALATIGTYEECWCGLPAGHAWEGQADGAAHPRDKPRPAP